jgi:hypothetical protein
MRKRISPVDADIGNNVTVGRRPFSCATSEPLRPNRVDGQPHKLPGQPSFSYGIGGAFSGAEDTRSYQPTQSYNHCRPITQRCRLNRATASMKNPFVGKNQIFIPRKKDETKREKNGTLCVLEKNSCGDFTSHQSPENHRELYILNFQRNH